MSFVVVTLSLPSGTRSLIFLLLEGISSKKYPERKNRLGLYDLNPLS